MKERDEREIHVRFQQKNYTNNSFSFMLNVLVYDLNDFLKETSSRGETQQVF